MTKDAENLLADVSKRLSQKEKDKFAIQCSTQKRFGPEAAKKVLEFLDKADPSSPNFDKEFLDEFLEQLGFNSNLNSE